MATTLQTDSNVDERPGTATFEGLNLAVVLPCYNEEGAIEKVVADFRRELPEATVYVYDNASTDRTSEVAREAGATVCVEPLKGKGNVVRRMFSDVDADYYILCDGDDTYPPEYVRELIGRAVDDRLDMVVGARQEQEDAAYRLGHRFGNRFLTGFVAWLFGDRFNDMLSGYRVFSRRFVKSFPAVTAGFEIETEFTIHALTLRMPAAEVPVPYRARPEGTESKLRTYRDGARILSLILLLFKEFRPFAFFTTIAVLLALLSVGLSIPVFQEYLETGLVPRFPTAILSTGIMLCAVLAFVCGIILDSVSRMRLESKRLRYLAVPLPDRNR